ncbi:MAG: winged helix-turn-helix transcriptional regulator [Acidobacteriaceae bacterium]|nr:winged helix-turn-helix transcriptional regulator [Acidobacteriaceae bacterium]MBV9497811.1 winged helix-turn-helix transcriptional regulator [Acidobacteriaceae bacterium]
MKKHFGCPVQATSNLLAGKWKVLIVWHLSFGQRRFAEIRDLLPGVSEKVLTAQLRDLERDGVIRRIARGVVPPRVDYMLSDAGEELVPVMEAMCNWGTKHLGVEPNLPRAARAGRTGSSRGLREERLGNRS